jgi:hypothetical protein
MLRSVTPEALDALSWDDPRAERSRFDLQRIHKVMGSSRVTRSALQLMKVRAATNRPLRVLELGAGDGSLMLRVAQRLSPMWPSVQLTLLDRVPVVSRSTIQSYAALGWTATSRKADVLDWASPSRTDAPQGVTLPSQFDVIVAHLFLHHFQGDELRAVLGAAARRGDHFFACEPRRSPLALAASHMVGALGANRITRSDAVLSVKAGFRDTELSRIWGEVSTDWRGREYPAGLFSHCFAAERRCALKQAKSA